MIPKRIHYCWFGKGKQNKLVKQCIKSWKKYCPDYELVLWNEENFDINQNAYVKEAYEAKKWAFVTDYVRLYVLYRYGGIYLDTDVEIIGSLDSFLDHPAFSGFESDVLIPTGIWGAKKGNPWIKLLLDDYKTRHFKIGDSYDLAPNVTMITRLTCKHYALQLNNTYQEFAGHFAIYPSDVFCPKNYETGELNLTEATKTIHHFNGSWLSKRRRFLMKKEAAFIKKYGQKEGKVLFARWHKKYHVIIFITTASPRELMQKIKKKCTGTKSDKA